MLKRAYDANATKKPGREDLVEILRASLTSYDLVFCHLDALDECPQEGEVREHVLEGVERLLKDAQNLRLLVTSRDESDIRLSIEMFDNTTVSVESEVVNSDIRQYIKTRMKRNSKLRLLNAATKTLVEETLSQKADGMYVVDL
jgi:2,3-bisphosphoglycerate-independent phosphoglycerate mutase